MKRKCYGTKNYINKVICGNCLNIMKKLDNNSIDSIITDPPYGWAFMGKKWDYDIPSVDIWKECLRVLKPGGYCVVACGTRTQHRMACDIEDAGFEIRDLIAWLYGSGFPKSLNIGKAVDKLQGNERREYLLPIAKPDSDCWGIPNNNSDGSQNGTSYNLNAQNVNIGAGMRKHTKGYSAWEGWGTALKPAMELWTVARKPLSEKTVAENVLKWGTGGININECRVETNPDIDDMERTVVRKKRESETWEKGSGFKNENNSKIGVRQDGRFPANIIHDGSDEVVSLFPNTKSGLMKQKIKGGKFNVYGKQYPRNVETIGDNGSAARFFYCAKTSKSERNIGCKKLKNNHPTVKPIKLMEYFVKLISKKGVIILDPFGGSGSTGKACKNLKRNYILIEKEKKYCEISDARINNIVRKAK